MWLRSHSQRGGASPLVASRSLQPRDCGLPGSSVHGIFSGQMLEWAAISFSGGYSWPRDQTRMSRVSYIAGRFLTC